MAMSNRLFISRIRVVNLNEDGSEDGNPYYGIVAATDEHVAVHLGFLTREYLEAAIAKAGSIALALEDQTGLLADFDTTRIGVGNVDIKDLGRRTDATL
jgi:hypothetical protein